MPSAVAAAFAFALGIREELPTAAKCLTLYELCLLRALMMIYEGESPDHGT